MREVWILGVLGDGTAAQAVLVLELRMVACLKKETCSRVERL